VLDPPRLEKSAVCPIPGGLSNITDRTTKGLVPIFVIVNNLGGDSVVVVVPPGAAVVGVVVAVVVVVSDTLVSLSVLKLVVYAAIPVPEIVTLKVSDPSFTEKSATGAIRNDPTSLLIVTVPESAVKSAALVVI
jgi:hypothetical protein